MENATKALIIAGSVAVSLLILSLGMYFYKQATSGVNLDKLSQAQKDEFNQDFTKYEGNAVSGVNVNELIQKVMRSNQNETTEESGKTIELTGTAAGKSIKIEKDGSSTGNISKVPSGYTYKVKVEIGEYGLVDSITVSN